MEKIIIMEKIPLTELAAREWIPNSPSIPQSWPQPCMEPSQRRVSGLQEHFPDRALDSPRPKDGSSSAQLQEEECPRMFWSICIPVPAQHTAAIPWEWWISDPCETTAKVPDERSFHRLWAPYGQVDFLSQPHWWRNVPGVRWDKFSLG